MDSSFWVTVLHFSLGFAFVFFLGTLIWNARLIYYRIFCWWHHEHAIGGIKRKTKK